jgi:hypothetical protein
MEPEEVVFRVLLFKLFNSIPAWQILSAKLGQLTWKTFDAATYGDILGKAKARGVKIWNAAYMQKPQTGSNLIGKHNNYLNLLERMMGSSITEGLLSAGTYEEAFRVLRTFPSPAMGDFTAMQFLTDINYSPLIHFDENDFIVPGPGAFDGMNKCFGLSLRGANSRDVKDASAIIDMCVERQEEFFKHFGETPVTLFGRRLHAIDCQNLFCETDKYARVAHAQFNLGRSTIKQKLKPAGALCHPFFPPKWG